MRCLSWATRVDSLGPTSGPLPTCGHVSSIGSRIEESSFSGLLTRVEIGRMQSPGARCTRRCGLDRALSCVCILTRFSARPAGRIHRHRSETAGWEVASGCYHETAALTLAGIANVL